MNLQLLSKEERKQMSFVEVAQHIFDEKREPIAFKDLVDEIASILEISGEELRSRMVQFYTDLNVEGRFLSLGENRWGLREWYPFEQIDEEVFVPAKPKKKKAKKAVAEDIEDLDDEDLDYDEDDFDDPEELIEDEEEEESLEALREEEEEEFEEEELLEDDAYEIEDEEEVELDEEVEEEEEEE
ncbi:DNA-directed RNA polymerase subunit delta [Lederbergia citrea]|uniref:DNA-directed RNA polymerase subunit delta n=1 Tax=Lederbergia citrea TaxID=2833581 RepID=UPI001BC90BD9|nr:DNA-directed RNA polymerase subunit delta [Lederbergia citrea]MBS4178037.1 DNA-directed RNA polymerase subunit delta [Lederbergia citrea]